MTTNDIETAIRMFLTPHFPGHELGDDDDIFALGYVNSLFAMQLVLFVEHKFGIELASEDLDMQNFRSVSCLTALVGSKFSVAP